MNFSSRQYFTGVTTYCWRELSVSSVWPSCRRCQEAWAWLPSDITLWAFSLCSVSFCCNKS
jgi:hypothetical protein